MTQLSGKWSCLTLSIRYSVRQGQNEQAGEGWLGQKLDVRADGAQKRPPPVWISEHPMLLPAGPQR